MLKKNKQLIIGFILGALLFSIVPAGATIQDYLLQKSTAKVMVDGKEFANKELPVLIYEGYNYIPASTFREICDIIGVGFEWVGEKNEIQVNTNKNAIVNTDKLDNFAEERKGEFMINIEKDGYKLFVAEGVEYISLREVGKNHEGYDFKYDSDTETFDFTYNPDKFNALRHLEVLWEDIPLNISFFNGATYIKYGYFTKNILPLIKE